MNPQHEKEFVRIMSGSDKQYQQSEFVSGYIFNSMCDPVHLEDMQLLDRYIELCPDSEPQFKEALISLRKVFQFIA